LGSFSTETAKADVRACPLRPESDRLPTNRDVSLRADIVAKVQNARDYFCRQMRIQAAIADGYTLKSATEVAGESIMR
jgi:hypothetical protein